MINPFCEKNTGRLKLILLLAAWLDQFQIYITGLNKQKISHVLGAQKNRLIETVLLSTNNICFVWEVRKINFRFTLLPKVLKYTLFKYSQQFGCG